MTSGITEAQSESGEVSGQKELFEVPVVQFLRPNGRRRDTSTALPVSCRAAVDDMHAAGCRFEAEVLMTGLVSVTISNPKEEEDADISITSNGPEVPAGMVAMLERGLWKNTSVGHGNDEQSAPPVTPNSF